MRAARPARLTNPPGAADRRVRLHRGLLQPPTTPLDPGLRQPRHLRAPAHLTNTCRITTVSTKPGQLQTLIDRAVKDGQRELVEQLWGHGPFVDHMVLRSFRRCA